MHKCWLTSELTSDVHNYYEASFFIIYFMDILCANDMFGCLLNMTTKFPKLDYVLLNYSNYEMFMNVCQVTNDVDLSVILTSKCGIVSLEQMVVRLSNLSESLTYSLPQQGKCELQSYSHTGLVLGVYQISPNDDSARVDLFLLIQSVLEHST